jgi:hypothetical protein
MCLALHGGVAHLLQGLKSQSTLTIKILKYLKKNIIFNITISKQYKNINLKLEFYNLLK